MLDGIRIAVVCSETRLIKVHRRELSFWRKNCFNVETSNLGLSFDQEGFDGNGTDA